MRVTPAPNKNTKGNPAAHVEHGHTCLSHTHTHTRAQEAQKIQEKHTQERIVQGEIDGVEQSVEDTRHGMETYTTREPHKCTGKQTRERELLTTHD